MGSSKDYLIGDPREGYGASAKRPGDPGTRRYNRLKNFAGMYAGKSPVDAAMTSGELERYMPVFGDPEESADPGEVVLAEIQRSAGHIRDLQQLIRKMELDELVGTETTYIDEEKVGDGEGNTYTLNRVERRREISKLYQLYLAERKHLSNVANGAVRAGIEIRRVRIAEAQLDRMQQAIVLALTDLGIDTGDSRVRKAIGTRIRELQSGTDFAVEPVQVPATREAVPVTPPKPPADF